MLKKLLLVTVCTAYISSVNATPSNTVQGHSRGYLTTPQELEIIRQKAKEKIEPYRAAVKKVLRVAGSPNSWIYGTIDGIQTCAEPQLPMVLYQSSVGFAKAMAYHLTKKPNYAKKVRKLLLDLTDTYGYGGEIYDGSNQCILNLSWYIAGWINAADLIEDYSEWSADDKLKFQTWLARVVYKKTAWASYRRHNNWGSAGSATSAMIADYLHDSGLSLHTVEPDSQTLSPAQAYQSHKMNQLRRMGTVWAGDSKCSIHGIQSYGGIPDELRRGSSGCNSRWLVDNDKSWMYTQTYMEGILSHAELLLRRQDPSIYKNIASDGSGSLRMAILFVIDNPVRPKKSRDWRASHKPTLELAYRYYRDPAIANQLGVGTDKRFKGKPSRQMLHFGTITHGFAVDEVPQLPPTVSPPHDMNIFGF